MMEFKKIPTGFFNQYLKIKHFQKDPLNCDQVMYQVETIQWTNCDGGTLNVSLAFLSCHRLVLPECVHV